MPRLFAPLLATFLFAGALLVPAAASRAAAPAPAEAEEKVVYHMNDASVARMAIANMNNHLNGSPKTKIVVVAHGKGIDFLLDGARDDKGSFASAVAALSARGVDFRVCRNTLKSRNLTDDAVMMEVNVVPSGVVEVARLQAKEGYVYLKP